MVVFTSLILWRCGRDQIPGAQVAVAPEPGTDAALAPEPPSTNKPAARQMRSKLKHKAGEFSEDEKTQFRANFASRYKPAIAKWATAFQGHLPFRPEAVTPEHLFERIGRDSSYNEYIFVVDGITLGVADAKGSAQVDYLNDPKQTQKLAMLPDGTEAPTLKNPVTRHQLVQMLEADSGIRFSAHEIRMTPSGLSGSLNGGVLVAVGGDPENLATWNFDLVFGPDSSLAFYLRGKPQLKQGVPGH